MRDPLTTRRLLAKIDREIDIYTVADRMRQAIYDIDDYTGKLEERIHALEQERVKFQTESGVIRIMDNKSAKETAKLSRKVVWGLMGLGGSATAALAGWVFKHVEWK